MFRLNAELKHQQGLRKQKGFVFNPIGFGMTVYQFFVGKLKLGGDSVWGKYYNAKCRCKVFR